MSRPDIRSVERLLCRSNGIKGASGAVAAASNRPRNDSPVWPYRNSSICTSRR